MPATAAIRRVLLTCVALAIVIRVIIAAASWNSLAGLDEAWSRVGRTHEMLGALATVRSAVYENDERRARQELARAWSLAADEPALRVNLDAAARALDAKAPKKALEALESGRAEALLLLEQRTKDQRQDAARAFQGILIAAAASIVVIVVLAVWFLSVLEELASRRDALRPGK